MNKMEKLNIVRDGEIKLPPGFRFQPTDEEIVFQYVARKVFSHPLPASIIPEINIFSFDPWELPGDAEQERYFFSNKRTDYRNVNQTGRANCGGYWKSSSEKQVICSKRDVPIVGIKKTMVFYKGIRQYPHHASKTDWIMHVYCIALAGSRACNINVQQNMNSHQGNCSVQIGDWVLCHVFLKKRNVKEEEEGSIDRLRGYNEYYMVEADTTTSDDDAESSSSSCADSDSSALTEVSSSTYADHGDDSSQNI